MKKSAVLAAAVMVCALGCASGQSYVKPGYDFSKIGKVAIVAVNSPMPGDAVKNEVTTDMAMQFNHRGYDVVSAGPTTGMMSDQSAVVQGRELGVDGVVVVDIPEFGEQINMSARMLDVNTGEIIWTGQGTGSTQRLLATVGGAVAGGAAGASLGHHHGERVVGALAGGALGGVAGHELAPSVTTVLRKVIDLVCSGLPARMMVPAPPQG